MKTLSGYILLAFIGLLAALPALHAQKRIEEIAVFCEARFAGEDISDVAEAATTIGQTSVHFVDANRVIVGYVDGLGMARHVCVVQARNRRVDRAYYAFVMCSFDELGDTFNYVGTSESGSPDEVERQRRDICNQS